MSEVTSYQFSKLELHIVRSKRIGFIRFEYREAVRSLAHDLYSRINSKIFVLTGCIVEFVLLVRRQCGKEDWEIDTATPISANGSKTLISLLAAMIETKIVSGRKASSN